MTNKQRVAWTVIIAVLSICFGDAANQLHFNPKLIILDLGWTPFELSTRNQTRNDNSEYIRLIYKKYAWMQ